MLVDLFLGLFYQLAVEPGRARGRAHAPRHPGRGGRPGLRCPGEGRPGGVRAGPAPGEGRVQPGGRAGNQRRGPDAPATRDAEVRPSSRAPRRASRATASTVRRWRRTGTPGGTRSPPTSWTGFWGCGSSRDRGAQARRQARLAAGLGGAAARPLRAGATTRGSRACRDVHARQRFFDYLIFNTDRHVRNVLLGSDWRPVVIDNSIAFHPFVRPYRPSTGSPRPGRGGRAPRSARVPGAVGPLPGEGRDPGTSGAAGPAAGAHGRGPRRGPGRRVLRVVRGDPTMNRGRARRRAC